MQTVDGYTIKDQFDTLKNLSNEFLSYMEKIIDFGKELFKNNAERASW